MAARSRSISAAPTTPFHDAVDHDLNSEEHSETLTDRKIPVLRRQMASESSQSPSVNGDSRSHSASLSHSRRPSIEVSEQAQTTNYNSPSNQIDHETPNHESPQRRLNYKLEHTLGGSHGHSKSVSAVKFSPDGIRLASCSADATVKIWLVETGELEWTFEGHMAGVSIVAWTPDSKWVASGSDDKIIRLWNVRTGLPHSVPFKGHSNYVMSLAISPKGNIIVSGSYDEAVFLWDIRSGRRMRNLPAHSDPVSGVDFVHDGTLIVSGSSDGLIRVWDTATGQCLRTIIHEDHAPVYGIKFSPNGKYVLAWTLDSSVRLWNYVEGKCVKTYQGHVNSNFSMGGAFGTYRDREYGGHQERAYILSGSEDGSIWIWDVSSKAVLQTIKDAHDGVIFGTDSHPRGGKLIASGGADGLVKIWRIEEQAEEEEPEDVEDGVMQEFESGTGAEDAIPQSPSEDVGIIDAMDES